MFFVINSSRYHQFLLARFDNDQGGLVALDTPTETVNALLAEAAHENETKTRCA